MTSDVHNAQTVEAFWKRVDRRGEDECWPWTGRKWQQHGVYYFNKNSNAMAHRMSWEIHYGPIPKNKVIRRACGLLTCCNPRHLVVGSYVPPPHRPCPRGHKHDPEYAAWKAMRRRCYRPSCADFQNYGGRGITVAAEWLNSYDTFLAYVGRRPSPKHSIDRIDNDRGYEPGNVRWATAKEQARNRRRSVKVSAFGETLSLGEWAERFGVSSDTIRQRLERGWDPSRAVVNGAQAVAT